jgi:hypothetical protein
MSCNSHPTKEVEYTCPIGCKYTLDIDERVVPVLQAMWKKGIHTNYSCQTDGDSCEIAMTINDYKKLMQIIADVEDCTDKSQVDWYEKVTSYKTSYSFACYLNDVLFDHPLDENLKNCGLQIEVDTTVFIPYKDLDIVIQKLNNYTELKKTEKLDFSRTSKNYPFDRYADQNLECYIDGGSFDANFVVPVLHAMWKRSIHTISWETKDDCCVIEMTINEYKKFMQIIADVKDFSDESQVDWYENVTSYKTDYKLAKYLNKVLLVHPVDENLKNYGIQIEVNATVFIPYKDLNKVIQKLNNYIEQKKTQKLHCHNGDGEMGFDIIDVNIEA